MSCCVMRYYSVSVCIPFTEKRIITGSVSHPSHTRVCACVCVFAVCFNCQINSLARCVGHSEVSQHQHYLILIAVRYSSNDFLSQMMSSFPRICYLKRSFQCVTEMATPYFHLENWEMWIGNMFAKWFEFLYLIFFVLGANFSLDQRLVVSPALESLLVPV